MDQRSDRTVVGDLRGLPGASSRRADAVSGSADPVRRELAGSASAPLAGVLCSTARCRFTGESKNGPGEVLSIEEVVRLTQVSRRRIAVYCRRGLLGLVADPEHDGWLFDREAIRTLFLLETMRRDFDLSLSEMSSTLLLRAKIESLQGAVWQARMGLQTLLASGPLKQRAG